MSEAGIVWAKKPLVVSGRELHMPGNVGGMFATKDCGDADACNIDSCSSATCAGTTDVNGVARCTIVVNQAPGAKSIALSFAGDSTCYLAGSRSGVLWVQERLVSTPRPETATAKRPFPGSPH